MKKIVVFLLSVVMLSAVCSGCSPAEQQENASGNGVDYTSTPFHFVKENTSGYTVVIPREYSEAEEFAAQEFCDFVKAATGAAIEIVTDDRLSGGRESEKIVSLGRTSALDSSSLDTDTGDLNNDGFVIRTEGESVFIFADRDRGTLYGVYEFLERFLGIRFVTPDFTHIPNADDVLLYQMNIVERPAFAYRNYYTAQLGEDPLFATRKRMISESTPNVAKYGYGMTQDFFDTRMHNTHMYVNFEVNHALHPDWFSDYIFEGTNAGSVDASIATPEICMTNGITEEGKLSDASESVARTMLESLKANIKSKPNAKYFMIGQMDRTNDNGYQMCSCPRCRKSDRENGGKSGTLIVLMNALCEEIEKWAKTEFPGESKEINLVTFAYQDTAVAPTKNAAEGGYEPYSALVKPHEHLFIRLAPIGANYYYGMNAPEQQVSERQMFLTWGALTKNLFVWDYATNYNEFLWYYPNFGSLQENYKYYRSLGVTYVLSQSSFNESQHFQTELKTYVASELMWNPDADAEALKAEFITLYYGPAADGVRSFIDYMDSFWVLNAQKGNKTEPFDSTRNFLKASNYPVRMLENALRIVENARDSVWSSALSETEKKAIDKRVVKVLLTPERMLLRNFTNYYDASLQHAFAEKFFEHADYVGLKMIGETIPLSRIKLQLGF